MTPSSRKEPVADRAGRAYWDELWAGVVGEAAEFPDPLQLTHVERSFARLFDETFAGVPRRSRMLEIGCAHSIWLPYFASLCQLTGLDYSEIGCAHTRAALERAGVAATIICGDAFAPPEGLEGSFDIVVSLGVVEHFEDTRAFA